MGWRIVYIEESEYLSLYLDNIKIKRNEQDIIIPLKDIHTLIIDNYKTVLSVNLLNKCSEEKINVVLCGLDHLPQTTIYPLSGNHRMPYELKKQIAWSEDVRKRLQKYIVKAKIRNQYKLLAQFFKSQEVIDRLQKFETEVTDGDIGNREGLAAKMYFRELFGKEFIRFEDTVINAGLNYGYAILRSQITKVLIGKGLNTSLGLFHHGPENMYNLSDDIIEVFRPIVDQWVYENLVKSEMFVRNHRIELLHLTVKNMKYNKEVHTLMNVIYLYVSNILDYIETGSLDRLIFPCILEYNV